MNIDYQKFLDEAMLEVVKKVLKAVQNEGLKVDQHFYISFRTDSPLVTLSTKMKKRYPKEITIVLQHQFKNLQVDDHKFSVELIFNGVQEKVEVPFLALTDFADPSTNFNLQFRNLANDQFLYNDTPLEKPADNVIMLDQFRNKNKNY